MGAHHYVKAVEGRLVPRYASLGGPLQFIGATRDGKAIAWNTDAVVCIPALEWTRYRREYERAVKDGSLELSTEAEFDAWQIARDAEHKTPATAVANEGDTL